MPTALPQPSAKPKILTSFPNAGKPKPAVNKVNQPANPPPMPQVAGVIKHPILCVQGIPIPPEALVITCAQAKVMLGWLDEDEYLAQKREENPKVDADSCKYGVHHLVEDMFKKKVRCYKNNKNRELVLAHVMELCQTILNRQWAGPTCFPGETINGEPIQIGRSGELISGQHRLIALVFACQLWQTQNAHWKDFWTEEPIIESLVVTGVSEAPQILQTIDYVRPRTQADAIYTSPVFQHLDNAGRKDCSRILAAAVDFLWNRLRMSDVHVHTSASWNRYKTPAEAIAFRERHPWLLECVHHLWTENGGGNDKGRCISAMRLSAGQCAAAMYLMGASDTDPDDYRQADPPREAILHPFNAETKQKAHDFWCMVTAEPTCDDSVKGEKIGPIHRELIRITETLVPDAEEEQPNAEFADKPVQASKFIVLAKAWHLFKNGEEITEEAIRPEYAEDANGKTQLAEWPGFGGIDNGPKRSKASEDAAPEAKDARVDRMELMRQAAADIAANNAKLAAEQQAAANPPLFSEEDRKRAEHRARLLQMQIQKVASAGKPPMPSKDGVPEIKLAPPKIKTPAPGSLGAKEKRGAQARINAEQTAKARAMDEADGTLPTGPIKGVNDE